MIEKHNASLAAGASSADIAVDSHVAHGVNTEVDCQVYAKNATTGRWFEMAFVRAGQAVIFYPTSATIKVTNLSSGAGNIQVTAP